MDTAPAHFSQIPWGALQYIPRPLTPRQLAYRRYLQTDHWIEFADAIRRRRAYRCQDCKGRGWQVHHLHYESLWHETDQDVVLLCGECHARRHAVK